MVLADTTAWSWSRRQAYPKLKESFDQRMIAGEVAICDMVRLELLHSARTPDEYAETSWELDALPQVEMDAKVWKRALGVHSQLAGRGRKAHRSVVHPDLLIAAAAEIAGVAVLHYDADYENIAKVTGQPTEWLAPRSTLR